MLRRVLGSWVFGLITVTSTTAFAADGFMSFEAQRSGRGDKERFGNVSYSVASPKDTATGQSTGKRQHKPVCVTRTPLPSSGHLVSALITNDTFKSVVFETSNGVRIKLTNASLASYKLFEDKENEELCFTFQSIELSVKGGPAMSDSWVGAASR